MNKVDARKALYVGKRIRMIEMSNDPNPIRWGARGTCTGVDDAGQLLMDWDNGRTLSIIPGIDVFSVENPDWRL